MKYASNFSAWQVTSYLIFLAKSLNWILWENDIVWDQLTRSTYYSIVTQTQRSLSGRSSPSFQTMDLKTNSLTCNLWCHFEINKIIELLMLSTLTSIWVICLFFTGANILVSAFTIVVIAVDRWRSVVNTNPRDNNLSYGRVVCVILLVWILAFSGWFQLCCIFRLVLSVWHF